MRSHQTNVYFVRSGPSWVLVDAGWASDGPAIKATASAVFGEDSRPDAILLTHPHPDHSGSARELALAWDRPVYVHPHDLPLATADFTAMAAASGPLDTFLILPLLRLVGRRRREAILARSSLQDVVHVLDPSAAVPGLRGWEWVPTPGHTPGHVAYFRRSDRVLITGDAIVTLMVNALSGLLLGRRGLSAPPWYTTWSRRSARESIIALARLAPSVLAGGHGEPMTGPGTAAALRAFAADVPPPP